MKRLGKNNIFYTLFKDKDEVLLEDAFSIGKRDLECTEENITWLRNKLSRWKKRGIAAPLYHATYNPASTRGQRHRLIGIKLTEHGKRLLGKPVSEKDTYHITLADVITVVERLQREHPDFEIRFEISGKSKQDQSLLSK
jgi:hypothetical protein